MALGLRTVSDKGRRRRRPEHPFTLKTRPWQIQPFMMAPVLPGETMKQLLLQSRVVTDPIKHPLVGWWKEYYFFYVKLRDLAERDDITPMFLNLDHSMTAVEATADAAHFYTKDNQIAWVEMCLNRIVATYFRDEDETGTINIGNLPACRINVQNWMDSLINEDNYVQPADMELTVGVDDKITAREIDETMRTYEFMRDNKLTDMSYEDFLGTYGVRPRPEEHHRPELLRYVREWQYPTNHVDPTNGTPSSAVSWGIAERADKDRFLREPGFIVGVTCTRPKVYLRNQTSTLTGVMRDALAWLPAILSDDPHSSVRYLAAGSHPIGGSSDGYWYDVKDLFLYGEQFANFALTNADASVALPTATLGAKYASATDADDLFSGTNKTIREDGVVKLDILGALVDTTPQGIQG